MIVLAITFLIVLISFNQIMKIYVENEVREDLNLTVNKVLNDIKQSGIDNFNGDRLSKIKLVKEIKLVGRFFDTNIIILSNNNRIIYNDDPLIINRDNIRDIFLDNNIIFNRKKIIVNNREVGSIIVYSYLEELIVVKRSISKILLISFILSFFVSLIFSNFFKKRISKPLIQLRDKIKNYDFNKTFQEIEVESDDEISELAESFNSMIRKLNEYSSQSKSFFQNASHELKTPLMSIQGYAEAIKEGVVTDEEIGESLDIIIEESKNLKQLVNNMILLTKLEDREESYIFEERLLFSVMEDAINKYRLIANDRNIKIEMNIDKSILINYDYKKMYIAISNLMSNGLRYAKQILTINIYKDAFNVYIEVIDDGDGIDESILNTLFDRFVKGKNGKSGIGLSLTKIIIENHNGIIKVKNNSELGVKFIITLPLNG